MKLNVTLLLASSIAVSQAATVTVTGTITSIVAVEYSTTTIYKSPTFEILPEASSDATETPATEVESETTSFPVVQASSANTDPAIPGSSHSSSALQYITVSLFPESGSNLIPPTDQKHTDPTDTETTTGSSTSTTAGEAPESSAKEGVSSSVQTPVSPSTPISSKASSTVILSSSAAKSSSASSTSSSSITTSSASSSLVEQKTSSSSSSSSVVEKTSSSAVVEKTSSSASSSVVQKTSSSSSSVAPLTTEKPVSSSAISFVVSDLDSYTSSLTSALESSKSSSASASSSAASSVRTLDSIESALLDETNLKRSLHGAPAMTWNWELADYAAEYAASNFDCNHVQLIHSGGPYGENLAAGYVGGVDPVDAWYDEIKDYDYSNPGYSSATGHFTQLIWASSLELGCAYVKCSNEWRQYTICEYTPRGNLVGTTYSLTYYLFTKNVLPLVK